MKRMDPFLIMILVVNFGVTSVVLYLYPSASGDLDERPLFVFAHITDSHLSHSKEILGKVVDWLAIQDISFVVHTGDIIGNPYDKTAWKEASQYMHQLDNRCNWAVLSGDNDIQSGRFDLSNYERYFGNNSMNQYFSVENKLLFILLGWNNMDGSISQEWLEWMDAIIESHKNMHVVICLHPHLFGPAFLNIQGAPNYEEVWNHIENHDNVIMTLCGHIHLNWVQIHADEERQVWSVSTEALKDRGYIRLFNVYEDRIEVHAYSPWANQTFSSTLDRFTVELSNNRDVDGDLWENALDVMPTHPLVPNVVLISLAIAISLLVYRLAR